MEPSKKKDLPAGRSKTVLTAAAGQVQIDVPRDRDGSFEPVIVRKRERRLSDVDEVVLSFGHMGSGCVNPKWPRHDGASWPQSEL